MVNEIWSYTSTKTSQDGAQKSGKVKDKTLLFLIIVKNTICINLFSVIFLKGQTADNECRLCFSLIT